MYCLAIGFGVLAVLYPITATTKDGVPYGLDGIILTGYYGFFCLFFIGVIFTQKHLYHNSGFIRSHWIKSFFYIFYASLAIASCILWVCYVVGIVFSCCAILNLVRLCGTNTETHVAK